MGGQTKCQGEWFDAYTFLVKYGVYVKIYGSKTQRKILKALIAFT